MKFTPRVFQQAAIEHAIEFLKTSPRGSKQLYAAPTGSGKSIIELCIQEAIPDTWIVTPREEIAFGMLDKLGATDDMLNHKICTPIRLRNMLLQGRIRQPSALIFDESHHHEASSWKQLDLLTGLVPSVGYTATPYRGSPRSTREFLEEWGEPLWLITYEEAVQEKYISMPSFSMLPLVDDDIIDIRGGEFDVTSLTGATVDRLGDLAEQSRKWYKDKWTRATVYSLPSAECCLRLQRELAARGMPSAIVSATTPKADRQVIFQATEEGIVALLHINIASEGIDLRLRRLVDCAPTMSPVKWVQHLGRITRPSDEQPEYICTNRNLLRHAYVLEGVIPESSIAAATEAFPSSDRNHTRVLGLEAIGRFKGTALKLMSGVNATMYSLSCSVGPVIVHYAVLVHPSKEPIWVSKVKINEKYGHWTRCTAPDDVTGFSSVPPNPLTEKQLAWWNRSAAAFGLDPDQEVTRKNFQALPILCDLGERFR
jgi:hypothetical protein